MPQHGAVTGFNAFPRRVRVTTAMLLATGLVALLSGCRQDPPPAERTWVAMGTYVTVAVPLRERARLVACESTTRDTMAELEKKLSLFRPESEVSRINSAAGQGPVPVSPLTRDVLQMAQFYSDISGGCFDVTVGPVVRLWGFNGGKTPRDIPDAGAVQAALQSTGYRRLLVQDRTAYLSASNMVVDLGGIAKGYAVDVAFHRLLSGGTSNVMVNLGGNLRCAGFARGSIPWRVGVRNPFVTDTIVGSMLLTAGRAVATSGHYERFVTIGGRHYAHIIDPRTGYPVEGMAGVTVIASSAVEADAMSTALFVAGLENAPAILRKLPDCHAILIPDRQPLELHISAGARAWFTPAPEFARAVRDLPR